MKDLQSREKKMNYQDLEKELSGLNDPDLNNEENWPRREQVILVLKEALAVLFPEHFHVNENDKHGEYLIRSLHDDLSISLASALPFSNAPERDPDALADDFLATFPHIKKLSLTDLQAIYDGDPAAKSKAEVIVSYPGFYAILVYRIAHELYIRNVPILPRIMTEHAHAKTGIDINPGATIGEYFCIDHGTGIVVGETATIGDHVKLYQGVTIGARSFELDADGNPVKGGKRHPDIGSHVVIYANATILGGNTVIGDYCEIGGNTWILSSVAPGSKVIQVAVPQKGMRK
jgi:serine O-acetyltransferase